MTDEPTTLEPNDEDTVVQESAAHLLADWWLQLLVSLANKQGVEVEVGITLQVGGALVTGTLTSAKKYFEWFADAFADGFRRAGAADGSTELHDTIARMGAGDEDHEDEARETPRYIHLREARVLQPDGSASPSFDRDGVWWRGRLIAVDGFILGSLQTTTT